ncbi:MAG: nucleotide-diphospho-sugar transferase [Candidatus Moranbacteria bacterium]|nr:nucleotide-diphospho-sugar transferase [Candidatus Moranbacteria bacterium]
MTENFTPPGLLKTAVLFLVFNRPDTTARVFEAIRQAKPPRLYVAADGPREGREGEAERVAKVREIATSVDWPCEVNTLFRELNLGCKVAVSGAITWFFEHEEQGIILEDDCLPSSSFFGFCESMLERFREDKSIWMINGFNPRYPSASSSKCFLSQNPSVWGWASWRDRWARYDVGLFSWNPKIKLGLHDRVPKYVHRYYKKVFQNTQKGLIDTWDYQLTSLILINNGFVIKPYANLISNIGIIGTHAGKKDLNHFVGLGKFSNEHDPDCTFELGQDLWFYRTRIKKSILSYPLRILKKIKNIIF